MVLVGRIARPHGLRGQVVVNPETDFVEERFRPGERLWTRTGGREETLTIESARVQKTHFDRSSPAAITSTSSSGASLRPWEASYSGR